VGAFRRGRETLWDMAGKPQPRFKSRRTLAPQPAPAGLFESTYDIEVGAAICRRIAAGESLRSICRTDAAMPTEKTVWNWGRAHREFRLMKAHAFAVARARSLAAREDAGLERRLEFGGEFGRTGRPSGYCDEIGEAILERLLMGEALAAVCREPGFPSKGTVYNWLKAEPAFLARYRATKAAIEWAMVEVCCEELPDVRRERDWDALIARTVRQTKRRARRFSLKRYAPTARGPMRVVIEERGGRQRLIYDEGPVGGASAQVFRARD
jgi:hypothetical protein